MIRNSLELKCICDMTQCSISADILWDGCDGCKASHKSHNGSFFISRKPVGEASDESEKRAAVCQASLFTPQRPADCFHLNLYP